MRIGSGFDVHAFTDGDQVVIGGVRIAHSRALLAHSDGDVLIHALCDALLGALALGDIGVHFPPSDARWKGADSTELLAQVMAMSRGRSHELGNADLTVICEAPNINQHSPAMRARLAELAGDQAHVQQAPLVLVWLADLARLEEIGRRAGAPTDALAFLETLFVGLIDAALAAQNALVALESLGLGGVFIGALRNRPEEAAQLLGLPPNVLAVFGLCVGYPDPDRPAQVKPRLSQRLVVHRERYDASLPQDALDAYETALKAFQEDQNMPVVGWAGTALNRVRGAQSLSGRDRMRAALTALGFGLR